MRLWFWRWIYAWTYARSLTLTNSNWVFQGWDYLSKAVMYWHLLWNWGLALKILDCFNVCYYRDFFDQTGYKTCFMKCFLDLEAIDFPYTVRPRLSGHIGTGAYPDKWFGRIWEICLNTESSVGLNTSDNVFTHCYSICNKLLFI